MKKFIPMFFLMLCLASCGTQIENTDTLRALVIGSTDSVNTINTYNMLKESTAATLTADITDTPETAILSEYDVIYIDKSAVNLPSFDAKTIESCVSDNGASVVLDNELYDYFDYSFTGAEAFVPINECPVDMEYPEADRDIKKYRN